MISGKQSTAFLFAALACCIGITAPILSAKTKSLMIADLNGDGKPDIITEDDQGRFYWNQNTLYTYQNWNGQFSRGGSIYRRAKIYPDTFSRAAPCRIQNMCRQKSHSGPTLNIPPIAEVWHAIF